MPMGWLPPLTSSSSECVFSVAAWLLCPPRTVTHQAPPLSTHFSVQECWMGQHFLLQEFSQPKDQTHTSWPLHCRQILYSLQPSGKPCQPPMTYVFLNSKLQNRASATVGFSSSLHNWKIYLLKLAPLTCLNQNVHFASEPAMFPSSTVHSANQLQRAKRQLYPNISQHSFTGKILNDHRQSEVVHRFSQNGRNKSILIMAIISSFFF